ncbi:MAG: hypothetical protein ACI8W8_002666 [Rhodothermales bacterium]|jgi:hypothetical protein
MRLLILPLLLGLCGCVSKPYDFDAEVDFCALETFAWEAEHTIGEDSVIDSELVEKRVQRAVETTLASAGYRTASVGETPDFVVSYRLAVTGEREPRMTGVISTGYSSGRRHRSHGTGITWVHVFDEHDAWSLLLDLHGKDGLIWRGWHRIDPNGASVSERDVQRAVTAILESFPPQPCLSTGG